MDLSLLAKIEDDIRCQIEKLPWNTKSDDNSKYKPLFDSYNEVHTAYASFSEESIEALKRAVFIQWYAWAEPGQLSGIGVLNSISTRKAAEVLNSTILATGLDDEFQWMLSHYMGVLDYPFESYNDLDGIQQLVAHSKERPDTKYPIAIDRVKMGERGGMGKYWNSMSF